VEPSPLAGFGIGGRLYSWAARASAAALARHAVVDRVLVHRSVATGEIAFGRSDIDLVVIVNPDPDGGRHGVEMLDLCRTLRRIRRVNPALNHVEAHDRPGWRAWLSIDTFRASQERRCAITLWGEPETLPATPIDPRHAVRHFVLYPLHYLVAVLAGGQRRHLSKIALEMWHAYAVATGALAEPFVRRDEMRAHYERSPERQQLGPLGRTPEALTAFMWNLARILHDRLLPPLAEFRERLSVALRVPPYRGVRPFVLPTVSSGDLPAARLNTTMLSPEALHLFIHYVNPFVWHGLPRELIEKGFSQPPVASFAEASRYQFRRQTLRAPGLMTDNTTLATAWADFLRGVLPRLESGESPAEGAFVLYGGSRRPTLAEYYREHFPRLCAAHQDIDRRLRELAGLRA
jgi:predicted nucleotidyltransferase